MHAHGVAGDLGDVLVSERNLVAAVASTNQISQILGALQAGSLADLVHRSDGALLGVDLGANGGVRDHLAGLVHNNSFRVGRAYVATAKEFHISISS